ncbi:hypothetical protein NBRC116188_11810 [Oceaniserpentilla sp. 4NH20-0058]|uniref:hypothetical protein n=1 Tax=Oceaniserpentilla sp. 4NH20-0058 TaxID=3127660 RepID=UPI00310C8440
MWLGLDKWFAGYYAYQARSHYKGHRYGLCLHYLNALSQWDEHFLNNPMYAGYMAICHYELKHWDNIITEVETALFLLRRHVDDNSDAQYLWQDLKNHLTDLRNVKPQNMPFKQVGGI